MLHEYGKRDIVECLYKQRIVLIGDSTVRQIYWALLRKMGFAQTSNEINIEIQDDRKHKDMRFIHDGVSFNFIWDPFLNTSGLTAELAHFELVSTSHYEPLGSFQNRIESIHSSASISEAKYSNESSALILVGSPGLWYARYGSENYLSEYKEAIDRATSSRNRRIRELYSVQHVLTVYPPWGNDWNSLLFAPIQPPQYSALSEIRASTITREKINRMQEYLQVTSDKDAMTVLWAYLGMTSNVPQAYKIDGLHVVDTVADRKADVLLNFRCNAKLAAKHKYDRTCCIAYSPLKWFHLITTVITLLLLATSGIGNMTRLRSRYPIVEAFMTVTAAIYACYLSDRTRLFFKSNKKFHLNLYLGGCFVLTFLGVSSLKRTWREQTRAPFSADIGNEVIGKGKNHQRDIEKELGL